MIGWAGGHFVYRDHCRNGHTPIKPKEKKKGSPFSFIDFKFERKCLSSSSTSTKTTTQPTTLSIYYAHVYDGEETERFIWFVTRGRLKNSLSLVYFGALTSPLPSFSLALLFIARASASVARDASDHFVNHFFLSHFHNKNINNNDQQLLSLFTRSSTKQ